MSNPRAPPCAEGTIRSARRSIDRGAPTHGRWVLAATILGSSMAFIDESVVNVALPAIETDLHASVAVIQWLINAYMLCLAALLLIGGAAGDRFGRRRIFVIGIGIFAGGSLWCGLAPSISQLILGRAIQGTGAALMIPCSLAIIGASFEEKERGKAIGTWAGVSAIAAAVGPLVGGGIVDHLSWRWIFLINPFLALPTIWIALRHLAESRDPDAATTLDWRGALLGFAGLGSLVFGLIASPERGWRDSMVLASIAAALILLVAFVWWERRARAPMMPLDVFRSRLFSGVNALTLLLYAALGGAFFFLPFELIQVHGYSATRAGAIFVPFTVIMGGLSRWSGGLLDRFGARLPLTIGPGIAAVGFALLALAGPGGSYLVTFLLPVSVVALGMAITAAPLTTAVINAVPSHRTGVASGINNAVASVASLLAVSILGTVALGSFNRALDRKAASPDVPAEVKPALERAKGSFVLAPALASVAGKNRGATESIVKEALSDGIRRAMWLAAALALAGTVCAALTIRGDDVRKHAEARPRPAKFRRRRTLRKSA